MLIWGKWQIYGGNIYRKCDIQETGNLYPGAQVEKIGRTTGARRGTVGQVLLQHWDSSLNNITYEIAITSRTRGEDFARRGDSGGCVFVHENGIYKAGGILIGKYILRDIVLATPLNIILGCTPNHQWASVEVLP